MLSLFFPEARQQLIDKEYRFETDEGSASLADLFKGRSHALGVRFFDKKV